MGKNKRIIKNPEIELLKDNRFVVRLPKQFTMPEYTVRSCDRPSLSAVWSDDNKKVVGYMWNPITITFFHPTTANVSKKIMEWVNSDLHIFQYMETDAYRKNNVEIDMLDPTGVVLEKWVLKDCRLLSVNFGKCDYNKDRMSRTVLKLQPRECILADMES